MKKQNYETPELELLLQPSGLNLLVNLSLDADLIDFEGDELLDFEE